jgi:hypothetical protein
MVYPLAHPEALALFKDILGGLVHESPRGAVLVGATHADNCLRDLFDATFPARLSQEGRRKLLKYPGPLSTFAARIDIAYASRLITRAVYEALHVLRDIRNDCAHDPATYDLAADEERARRIYAALGPTIPDGIRAWAWELLLDFKMTGILEAFQEAGRDDPQVASLGITDKSRALAFVRAHEPEMLNAMRKTLPQWELALGVAGICSLIIYFREASRAVLAGDLTINKLQQRPTPAEDGGSREDEPPP